MMAMTDRKSTMELVAVRTSTPVVVTAACSGHRFDTMSAADADVITKQPPSQAWFKTDDVRQRSTLL